MAKVELDLNTGGSGDLLDEIRSLIEDARRQTAAGGAWVGRYEARHSGKSHRVLRKGAAMKYAWVKKNKLLRPVYVQCRVLGVSTLDYR